MSRIGRAPPLSDWSVVPVRVFGLVSTTGVVGGPSCRVPNGDIKSDGIGHGGAAGRTGDLAELLQRRHQTADQIATPDDAHRGRRDPDTRGVVDPRTGPLAGDDLHPVGHGIDDEQHRPRRVSHPGVRALGPLPHRSAHVADHGRELQAAGLTGVLQRPLDLPTATAAETVTSRHPNRLPPWRRSGPLPAPSRRW